MTAAKAKRSAFPAFGRELYNRRKTGFAPATGTVVVATDWVYGKSFEWRVVVRPDDRIRELDLRFVAGLDVLILADTTDQVEALRARLAAFSPGIIAGVAFSEQRIVP